MGLSEALRRRRSALNLTLKDIADKLGVTEATVQRYESGNIKQLRHGRILRLAEILETTPAYLMGWTNKVDGAWDEELTAEEVLEATEKPATNEGDGLTDAERKHIKLYRAASPELQAAALAMLEAAEKARLARDSSAKDK